jgi:hypothetical protein
MEGFFYLCIYVFGIIVGYVLNDFYLRWQWIKKRKCASFSDFISCWRFPRNIRLLQ